MSELPPLEDSNTIEQEQVDSSGERKLNIKWLVLLVLSGFILVPIVIVVILFIQDQNISIIEPVITNVTDTGFSVTWVSEEPYIGRVIYKESGGDWPVLFAQNGKTIVYDDRDVKLTQEGTYVQKENGILPRYTHHVTVRNVKPATSYDVRIAGAINGKDIGIPVFTKGIIEDINTPDPAYGKIKGVQNSDAILIFTPTKVDIEAGETVESISVPVSENGTYSFDLNQIPKEVKAKDLNVSIRSEKVKIENYSFSSDDYKPLETIVVEDYDLASINSIISHPNKDVLGIPNRSLVTEVMALDIGDEISEISCGSKSLYWIGPSTGKCLWCMTPGVNRSGTAKVVEDACCNGGSCENGNLPNSDTEEGGSETSDDSSNTSEPSSPPSSDPSSVNNGNGVSSSNSHSGVTCGGTSLYWIGPSTGKCLWCKTPGMNSSGAAKEVNSQCCESNRPCNCAEDEETCGLNSDSKASEHTEYTREEDENPNTEQSNPEENPLETNQEPPDDPNEVNAGNNEPFYNDCGENSPVYDKSLFVSGQKTKNGRIEFIFCMKNEAPKVFCYYGADVSVNEISGKREVRCKSEEEESDVPVNDPEQSEKIAKITEGPQLGSGDGEHCEGYCFEFKNQNSFPDGTVCTGADFKTRYLCDDGVWTTHYNYDYAIVLCFYHVPVNLCYEQVPVQREKVRLENCYDNNNNNTPCGKLYDEDGETEFKIYYEGVRSDLPPNRSQLKCCQDNANADGCDDDQSNYLKEMNLNNEILDNISAQSPASREAVLGASDEKDYLTAEESGRYVFFQDGERIAEEDIITRGDQVKIRLYDDLNGNSQKDPDEEYYEDYSQISIAKEASVESFVLYTGWNLIHIPMIDTRTENVINTASSLIDYWQQQGADVIHIASYKDGKFEMYTQRESGNEYDSTDFDINPGDGLFVMNLGVNVEVTFSGNKVEDAWPVKLDNGWNLVGIISPDQEYNSEGLLSAVSDQGITADTISQFENGIYQSVIYEDSTLFGNNFNIIDKRGYFLRVQAGGDKTFTP